MQKRNKPHSKVYSRILAAVLCLVMTVSYMPSAKAIAAEVPDDAALEAAADASLDAEAAGESEDLTDTAETGGEGKELLPEDEAGEDGAPNEEAGSGALDEAGIIEEADKDLVNAVTEFDFNYAMARGTAKGEITFSAEFYNDNTPLEPKASKTMAAEENEASGTQAYTSGSVTSIDIKVNAGDNYIDYSDSSKSYIRVRINGAEEATDIAEIDKTLAEQLISTNGANLPLSAYFTDETITSLIIDVKFTFTATDPSQQPKYKLAIEADGSVTANNCGIFVDFYDESDGKLPSSGYSIEPGNAEAEHRYTNGTPEGGSNIPDGASYARIRVQTAGMDIDTENGEKFYFKVNGSTIFSEENPVDEVVAALTSEAEDGGYVLSLANVELFDIGIYIIPPEGPDPGPDPQPEVNPGQYFVMINTGGGIPDGVTPSVKVRFDTQAEPMEFSQSMDSAQNLPKDAQDHTPTAIEISVPGEYMEYFANGHLVITKGNNPEGRQEIDIFDPIRDSEDNTYTYSVEEGTLDTESKYEIDVTFSHTRSVSWSYREQDKDRDTYVEHCKIFLVYEAGKGLPDEDAEGNPLEEGDDVPIMDVDAQGAEGYGNYQLFIGQTYKFRLVPDKGYQVTGLKINDYNVVPADADNPGVFSFTMEDRNFHMNSVVEKVGTLATVTAYKVGELKINNKDVSGFDPEKKAGDGTGNGFDDNLGGSYMITVEDAQDGAVAYKDAAGVSDEVKAMLPQDTLEISIDQAVAQDKVSNNPDYWEEDEVIKETASPAKFSFGYPGEKDAAYKVATEHNGQVKIIDAAYNDETGELSFATSEFSKFTILKEKTAADEVVFDFANAYLDDGAYLLKPVSGLVKVSDAEADKDKYTYTGEGDIRLEVLKKADDNTYKKFTMADGFYHGLVSRFTAFFDWGPEDDHDYGEQWRMIDSDDTTEDGCFITIPAVIDDNENLYQPYFIKSMIADAIEGTAEGETATIRIGGWPNHYPPARQFLIAGVDDEAVEFTADTTNIITKTEGDEIYHYITGGENMKFKLNVGEYKKIDSVYYTVMDFMPAEDGSVYAYELPDYAPVRIAADANGVFTIPVPYPGEGWEFRRLGVELRVVAEDQTVVTVDFGEDAAKYLAAKDGNLISAFNVSARSGARNCEMFYDTVDGRIQFFTFVKRGDPVTVKIESEDGYNTVVDAKVTDAAKTNAVVKPSKTGEFTLATGSKDDVLLVANADPVSKLVITNNKGEILDPVKGKYTLNSAFTFKAKVINGSFLNEAKTAIEPHIETGTEYKNGTAAITGATIEGGVLTATGAGLGLSGKPLALKATAGGKTFTANLTFFTPVTSIKIAGADNAGVVTVPYNTDKALKVTLSNGADLEHIDLWAFKGSNRIDIGEFDGKNLNVDAAKVLHSCGPEDTVTLEFMDAVTGSKITAGGDFKIKFTDGLEGKDPAIKKNDKLATNQKLGLTLTLPKGVKTTEGMYWEITAKVHDLGNKEKVIINGTDVYYYPRLAYVRYDEELRKDVIQEVYSTERVTAYFPASAKACEMNVAYDPYCLEDGWRVEFDVKARLVYKDGATIKGSSNTTEWVDAETRDNTFETKLGLTKKAPAKMYTGQMGILLAVAKWSATTSVKSLDYVELTGPQGEGRGSWSRWTDSDANNRDQEMNWYLEVDEDAGAIYLNTIQEFRYYDEEDHELVDWDHLDPGKYTITAYAVGGPGQSAKATMSFTLSQGITDIYVAVPGKVVKTYNKKATFKPEVQYYAWPLQPATKKVEWTVLKEAPCEENGYEDVEFVEGDPLYGMVSVKNGTVTIAANYNVSAFSGDNYFILKATAADYEGNGAEYYTGSIEITSTPQVPTTIRLGWEHYEEETGEIWWDYSGITEENAQYEKFFSNQVNYTQVLVYDQYGDPMETDIKVSGLSIDKEHNQLFVTKPGKCSITATARDGGKKSKVLKFTTIYADGGYSPNVLIQNADAERNSHDRWTFINIDQGKKDDKGHDVGEFQQGLKTAENSFTGASPIYVNVGGIRSGDWGDEDYIPWEEKDYDYHDTAMINHSIKVDGGKITATLTGRFEHYVTYKIVPSKSVTTITVTDNTVDSRSGRTKGKPIVYTVTNKGMSDAAALKITADKKNIYNRLDIKKDYVKDVTALQNHVTYTVKGDPAKKDKLYVRITMDSEVSDAQWRLGEILGLGDDYQRAHGRYIKLNYDAASQAYTFSLDFFEDWDDRYNLYGITSGTYSFYATVVESAKNPESEDFREEDCVTVAKMSKLSVKAVNVPKASSKLTPVAYTLTDTGTEGDFGAELAIATVTSGVGVRHEIWTYHDGEDGDKLKYDGNVYEVRSTNNKGVTNRFNELFWVQDAVKGKAAAEETRKQEIIDPDSNDKPALKPHGNFEAYITVGIKTIRIHDFNDNQHPDVWRQLYILKEGRFTAGEGDFVEYYDGNGAVLVGTAAQQKAAYTKWAKENLTGYVRYSVVDCSGVESDAFQKITVNIDNLLDSRKDQ